MGRLILHPLIHTYEKAVVKAGGVEGGSYALMAIDLKAVADELGIPMLKGVTILCPATQVK
jgi:hypothetical protein